MLEFVDERTVNQTLVFAMGSTGPGAAWMSFVPFAMILAIFYFLILMPMKKRQKKVQEFQTGLKVGDKIVTTSGIYGHITRVNDKSVQVQIADKVRIEIARAAVGGYQGQEPVVAGIGKRITHGAYKNLRWKTLTILGIVVLFAAVGVYPMLAQRLRLPAPAWLMAKQLQLGLDLKGGVHLVMRVNRDDALRISTEGVGEQLREALSTAGITVSAITVTSPTTFRVEGVPQDKDAEFRRIAEDQTNVNYERSSGAGGAYEFTMKPNIARTCASRRSCRRTTRSTAASTSSASPSRTSRSTATMAIRSSCSCPASPTSRARRRSFNPRRSSSSSSSRAGRLPAARRCSSRTAARCRRTWKSCSGAADPSSGETGTMFYLVRKVAAVNGQRPAQRKRRARREQPARGQLLAQARWRAQVRQGHGREHRPLARHRARQPGPVVPAHRRPDHRARAASPAASRSRRRRTSR